MIKFFRKIRQKMLTENKLSKYLLYAIGEIILVVIGILIALSVNNQNELRKEKIEEEKILIGIKNDFIETRKRLIRTIYKQEEAVQKSLRLINLIEHGKAQFNSDSISSYLTFGALSYWRSEPVIGTYDALIGAGNTSIIQNQKLFALLAKFSAISKLPFEDEINSMNLLKLIHESISDYNYVITADGNRAFMGANYRYSEQDKQAAIKKLIKNKSFLSNSLMRTNMEQNRLERQISLLGYSEEILVLLGVKGITLSADELNKYEGTYELTDDRENKDAFKTMIFARDNKLYAYAFNSELIMIPENQDSYYVPGIDALVKFKLKSNKAIGFSCFIKDNSELKFKKN